MEKLEELSQFLGTHFQTDLISSATSLDSDSAILQHIKLKLKAIILNLLQGNHQKLLDILYRIDISEGATNKALNLGIPEKIAEDLAQAIIERQLKKVHYRQTIK